MIEMQNALRMQSAALTARQGQARHALVSAVDPTSHSVKVTIQPEGVVSGWLPDPGLACAGLRICCPCEVGTQVLIVPVEGDAEHPVIVARVFDTVMLPPVSPATGQPVQPGEIGFFLNNGNFLHLTMSGVWVKGNVTVQGSITVSGDVVAQTISLTQHLHGGVALGSGTTGLPEQ